MIRWTVRIVRAFIIGFFVGTICIFSPLPPLPVALQTALAQEASTITPDMVPMVVGPDGGQGSGVAYLPGVVLTAKHVVDEYQARVHVTFTSGRQEGVVTCISEDNLDIAIVRLDSADHPYTPVQVTNVPVVIGQPVIVAGWANGRWTIYPSQVVQIMYDAGTHGDQGSYTTAEMIVVRHHPPGKIFGMSGGGLFDIEGRLIGLICCGRHAIADFFAEVGVVPLRRSVEACTLP